jgi:hypothetical protein
MTYYSGRMTDAFPPTPRSDRRTNVMNFRLGESGRVWLAGMAEKHGVTQTEVIKAALSFAAKREADFGMIVEKRKR